jgi:hypothetical protein
VESTRESREAEGNRIRKEGEYWTVSYEGRTFRLKDSKGLLYLSHLLHHSGREFHVTDLAALAAAPEALGEENRAFAIESDLGVILDPRAAAEYRQRLRELRDELADATAANDLGRVDRARDESERIASALTAAYGLGGRARSAGDPGERMRKAVTNQIRRAVERVRVADPGLGGHLENALRTGFFCSYRPDRALKWST